jgi:hypothetical protein
MIHRQGELLVIQTFTPHLTEFKYFPSSLIGKQTPHSVTQEQLIQLQGVIKHSE